VETESPLIKVACHGYAADLDAIKARILARREGAPRAKHSRCACKIPLLIEEVLNFSILYDLDNRCQPNVRYRTSKADFKPTQKPRRKRPARATQQWRDVVPCVCLSPLSTSAAEDALARLWCCLEEHGLPSPEISVESGPGGTVRLELTVTEPTLVVLAASWHGQFLFSANTAAEPAD
jgi:hypothetical protein